MFKLNERDEIKKFVLRERIAFFIYILYCIVVIVGKFYIFGLLLTASINGDTTHSELRWDLLFANEVPPLVIMCLVFGILL